MPRSEAIQRAVAEARFVGYLEQLATNDQLRGTQVDASQLWALYQETTRPSAPSLVEVAEDLGLPLPPGIRLIEEKEV